MVSYSDIEEFAQKYNLYYMETSAKSEEKAGDCFTVITYLMMGIDVSEELLGKKGLRAV